MTDAERGATMSPDRAAGPARPDFGESWGDFLQLVASLGAFIPQSFWEILKVARVIFTPGNPVSDALKPTFSSVVKASDDEGQRDYVPVKVPVINTFSSQPIYRRIKGVEEIGLVSATDLAMLDLDELLVQASEQQLFVRVMSPEVSSKLREEIRPITTAQDSRALNPAAQKVYVLMDTSYSMRESSRIVFAKAILLEYLRVKSKGSSKIFFRAFDVRPYEVLETKSREDYDRVMRAVLFAQPRGKGTDIQTAILSASSDIRTDEMFRDAEIVLVTDGIDRFDVQAIRAALAGTIKLHTFKIGFDSQEPEPSEVRDIKKADRTPELITAEEIVAKFQARLTSDFIAISDTFIELPDLDEMFYQLEPEAYEFMRESVKRMTGAEIGETSGAKKHELFRRASFLHDFMSFAIADLEGREEPTEQMLNLLEELRGLLADLRGLIMKLLSDRDVLLRVAKSGDPTLAASESFRKRAEREGIPVVVNDTLAGDDELRIAIGLPGSGGVRGRAISLIGLVVKFIKRGWRRVKSILRRKEE